MGKQRKGGLPYLRTSLKFDWNSSRQVSEDETNSLLTDVISYLEENGCKNDQTEQTEQSSCHSSNFHNDSVAFGLQACLDEVKTEKTAVVFLDSSCPRPSAVSNALGLYFNNYAETAKVYCLPGVKDLLLNKLNRNENAFVLKNCPDELRKRFEHAWSTIRVKSGRLNSPYSPVSLIKSMGKPNKGIGK